MKILKVVDTDYRKISIRRYFLNVERGKILMFNKLVIKEQDGILGLVLFDRIDSESRVEIQLLYALFENRGVTRNYKRIPGAWSVWLAEKRLKNIQISHVFS